MSCIISEVCFFASEILILIDKGESIPVAEFERIMDEKRIVPYIKEKYGFKNLNSTPENQQLLQQYLNEEVYVSEREAYKKGIDNNGLVYLLAILMDLLEHEAYEYKWNWEELASNR